MFLHCQRDDGAPPSLPTGSNWAGDGNPTLITARSQSGPDSWRVIAQTFTDYRYVDGNGNVQTAPSVTIVLAIDIGNLDALVTRRDPATFFPPGAERLQGAATILAQAVENGPILNDGHRSSRPADRPPATSAEAITKPSWVRLPNAGDMSKFYPVAAAKARIEGRATLHCTVTAAGAVTTSGECGGANDRIDGTRSENA